MSNEIINVKVLNPVEVFMGDEPTLDTQIKVVMDEVEAFTADVTTSKGRDECRSLAAKVTRSKTALDGLGKDYLAKENERLSHINPLRKSMREKLEQAAKDVRKPLTDWEEAESEKERVLESHLQDLKDMSHETNTDIVTLASFLANAEATEIDDSWGKLEMHAELAKKRAIEYLTQRIIDLKAQAKEREELEAFRKEKAEQAEKDRVAKVESDRQEREAEIAANATKKAEEETRAAEERAEQAEERRIQELADAEARAEQNKNDAAEEAARDKDRAIQEEKDRVERENKRIADEEAKRAANKKHNHKIHSEAKEALIVAGLSEQAAKQAVIAIAKNMIPHITIQY